jgi:hypothetical protein
MHVQGWRASASTPACINLLAEPNTTLWSKNRKEAKVSTEQHSVKNDVVRKELLTTIKNRIKSGFYDKEAVIEDIGHGFAKALDHTL